MEALTRHVYVVDGWGTGEIWVRGACLIYHVLAGEALTADGDSPTQPPTSPRGAGGPPVSTIDAVVTPACATFVSDLRQRFVAHLAGERTGYERVAIDLSEPTEFETALADALRAVAWGETVTYGELAARAGRPGAARAAGGFCALGTVELVLPYHRVVSASGIGGFGPAGVDVKRRLLELEGAVL